MRLSPTAIVLFLFLLSGSAHSIVFDITTFGGAPNSDITQAFLSAWKQACASTRPSKIVISEGTYEMNAVDVKGPCKAPIEIQVDGTIQAPTNPFALDGAFQWVTIGYVDYFTLSGRGTFDGRGATAWKLQEECGTNPACTKRSMNIGFNFMKHSVVRSVTSKDSKFFHVSLLGCTDFTFDDFKISAPGDSINTDGIHIAKSTDVKILNSDIATGDDCVSLGDGNKQITIQNVKCGPGHGFSVGSLGTNPNEEPVENLIVKNCTLTNTQNGVRIKTWPNAPGTSPVTNLTFEDITMVNVYNPVIIDQQYCPFEICSKQSPSKIKISNVKFKNIKGTSETKEGVILNCSSGVPCEGVELSDISLTFDGAPAVAKCANVKPIIIGKAPSCRA